MDVPAINILSLLAHLRKVILQDAVVLMDISSENHLSNYSLHGIFRHKVFQDPQFHSYRLALKDAMANATSPYLDSLNANSPAIVNELRGVSTKLSHDLQHVQASIDNLTQRADEISSNTRTLKGDFIDERHRQSEATALAVSGEFNRFAASMLNIMKQVAQQLQVSVAEESVSLGLTSNMQPAKGLGLASNQSRLQKQKPTQRQAQEQHGQGLEQQQMNQDNNQDQDQDQNYEQGQGIQELNQRQEQAQQEPGQKQQDEVGQDIPLVQKRFKKLWTDSRIKEIQNLENSLATPQMEVTIDKYDMLHQKHSLREHWNEWFYGHNDYPSIWRLNKFKGRSWRASNSARRYKFKKDVIYSILDRMLTMEERVALNEVEQLLVSSSLNKYYNDLHS
ncbi:hypothetical protein BCR41DRAFT_363714 [Lobosporangium transversale]|uniref:Transcription activator GCR1-like domain-containing protein n=1 Tax=Lobosporangium transversale TaxID=64571 RepID=A0A1Y2GBE7_9FUNG|nr:hypothetical protein BCR41DRAFT_363714 [Lobosporangium transversale]ORY99771.1 hypothetical protein BCR41DRAFT_363714 [Lobosporangium transversale]|eukprot:XP_021876005.1 hypothetical protein BCR41DRAFT_363714 [Lobosporangium transversale]